MIADMSIYLPQKAHFFKAGRQAMIITPIQPKKKVAARAAPSLFLDVPIIIPTKMESIHDSSQMLNRSI